MSDSTRTIEEAISDTLSSASIPQTVNGLLAYLDEFYYTLCDLQPDNTKFTKIDNKRYKVLQQVADMELTSQMSAEDKAKFHPLAVAYPLIYNRILSGHMLPPHYHQAMKDEDVQRILLSGNNNNKSRAHLRKP